jgi:hypothetical protein
LPGKSALAIVADDRGVVTHPGWSIVEAPREHRTLDTATSFATYWYFHLPNFILAALMYTLLGRAILGLIVEPTSSNYIWRFFCRITDPVVALITPVTPKAAAPVVVWLFGVVWLFWLRVGLLYVFLLLGAVPKAS